MTDDMLSWLRRQIETRKALAGEAHGASWAVLDQLVERLDGGADDRVTLVDADDRTELFSVTVPGSGLDEDDVAHIAFNDPRQIIADCEADLATLDQCEKYLGGEGIELMWHAANLARRVLDELAKAYEWAPEGTTP